MKLYVVAFGRGNPDWLTSWGPLPSICLSGCNSVAECLLPKQAPHPQSWDVFRQIRKQEVEADTPLILCDPDYASIAPSSSLIAWV